MASNANRNVDLTYEDIIALKAKKEIILVDVREHNEIQETGKLPDSIHIPRMYELCTVFIFSNMNCMPRT